MEELILFMVWISVVGMILSLYSTSSWFGAVICRQDLSKSTKGDIHYASWWQRRWSFPSKQAHLSRSDHSLFEANLPTGLFGKKKVYLSQLPLKDAAPKGAWLTLLSVIHPTPSNGNCQIMPGRQAETWSKCSLGDKHTERQPEKTPKNSWPDVANHGLYQHKAAPEIVISRTTFMALLCLTNSRPVVHHSSASGHRAAYPSYCGQWRVEWPIGDRARVYFFEHDLYPSSKALYPPTFEQRVDKCLQMLAGVIDSQTSSFKCAFSGRKSPGKYLLEYGPKGFGAVHSGRHLYHMMGGNVSEVDYLFMKGIGEDVELGEEYAVVLLPNNKDGERNVTLYVPGKEAAILNEALDKLPWTFLSWSIHRGLRDLLVAFAKERMDSYRTRLADTLRFAVFTWPERLDARGWDSRFVRENMADLAASAILAGQGNSGDAVRIVTDIATIMWDGDISALDETKLWRDSVSKPCSSALSPMDVTALVKCFVLEWSMDLNYQMYHDFPMELYLV